VAKLTADICKNHVNRGDITALIHTHQNVTFFISITLDLLLTSASDTGFLSRVAVQPTCFSDHDLVTCRLHVPCDPPTVAKYQYRDIHRINIAAFQNDILQSLLYNFDRPTSVDDYVQLFNDEVQQIVDKHAPLKSRTRRISRNDCRWLSPEAREAKRR